MGIAVGLNGSHTGVNYQLILNGTTNVGAPVVGTGGAFSFGNQTVAGNYNVTGTFASTAYVADMGSPFSISILTNTDWTGATSTAWETASNWGYGVVPNASTVQVNIPSAPANQPVLNSGVF